MIRKKCQGEPAAGEGEGEGGVEFDNNPTQAPVAIDPAHKPSYDPETGVQLSPSAPMPYFDPQADPPAVKPSAPYVNEVALNESEFGKANAAVGQGQGVQNVKPIGGVDGW
jgi:hypothetical protein